MHLDTESTPVQSCDSKLQAVFMPPFYQEAHMDPRQPQNGASWPERGFHLDEATRASFQHADHTSAFSIYGESVSIPDPWTNDHQSSTTNPIQGRTSAHNKVQGSWEPDNAPYTVVPGDENGRHDSVVDPIEERGPVQSPHQPPTSPIIALSTLVAGTNNDYQGSAMPAQGQASVPSPRQTSMCPIYAPEVLIPGTGHGRESVEIDPTHRNYIHGPVAPAGPHRTYQSRRMEADLDVPRQQKYQPENLHAVVSPPIPDSIDIPRAEPTQKGSILNPEQGTRAQTQQPNAHNRSSSQLAGASAANAIELDTNEYGGDLDYEHPIPRHSAPPARSNPQQADRAFQDQREHSSIIRELNTPHSRRPSPQQISHQASPFPGGRLNLPSYRVPASAPHEATETGHINRRKRSQNLFESDDHYTPVVASALYTRSFVGDHPQSGYISDSGSVRDDDVSDDEGTEEEYRGIGVRQASSKRRRLGDGSVAQDRQGYSVNDHGGPSRSDYPINNFIDHFGGPSRPPYPSNNFGGPSHPSYPINDRDDTRLATFPINDGKGLPQRDYPDYDGIARSTDPVSGFDRTSRPTHPVSNLGDTSSGFRGESQGGFSGTLSNTNGPAFTGRTNRPPTSASTGARPIGRRARGNHGELRQDPDGHVMFRAHGSQDWEPTRYHDEARAEMIGFMAQVGQYGETSGGRQPERGADPLDVTSFNPPQYRWFFTGESGRVDWDESQNPYLYRYERRGLQNPSYEPGPLRFRGSVILSNRDHQPMTDWRDLPLTISSQISGGWMENIQRVDSRISVNDFQDRMPRTTVTARSALTNRMGRFRTNNGLASWNCRDGTQRIKDIMLRHLTAEQVRENTTMGYDGLTKEELAEIERRNEASGKYDKRAGKNGKRRR